MGDRRCGSVVAGLVRAKWVCGSVRTMWVCGLIRPMWAVCGGELGWRGKSIWCAKNSNIAI